jgi:rubrerythrin
MAEIRQSLVLYACRACGFVGTINWRNGQDDMCPVCMARARDIDQITISGPVRIGKAPHTEGSGS